MTHRENPGNLPRLFDSENSIPLRPADKHVLENWELFKTGCHSLGLWPLIVAESRSQYGTEDPDLLTIDQKFALADAYEQVLAEIIRRTGYSPWERNS